MRFVTTSEAAQMFVDAARLDRATRRVIDRNAGMRLNLLAAAADEREGRAPSFLAAVMARRPFALALIGAEYGYLTDLETSAATMRRHSEENAQRRSVWANEKMLRPIPHIGCDP